MRKKLVIILITLLVLGFFGGIGVLAYKNNQKSIQNTDSNIEDIVFDEEKVNMYLFWGDGCPHCEELMKFLDNIEEEYKDLYNLYKFEVWHNEDNSQLMDQVADKFGKEANGVPFLVIGEESFIGYNEVMNKDIKKAIKEQVKNDFDVYQELNK